jgi:hypothetical protein
LAQIFTERGFGVEGSLAVYAGVDVVEDGYEVVAGARPFDSAQTAVFVVAQDRQGRTSGGMILGIS